MQDSLTLDLYHAARGFQERLTRHLATALRSQHGTSLNPAQLSFLAALLCGENTASEVARRIGVSRQATQRQAAALAELGYLWICPDPERRNQSLITFTDDGMQLMAICRSILATWEDDLAPEAETLRRAAQIMARVLPD
jgi:DNA-binding MarR family transcriptional regulator